MAIPTHQRTLDHEVSCSGIGLHSGKEVHLALKPAPINHGIKFIRKDLPDNPTIPARFNCVVDTSLATVIGLDGAIVSTIEHLMACLAGLSVDNVVVELDSYEVPVMDGSAGPFTRMILEAGIREQNAERHFFVLKKPIELNQDGKFVGIYPDTTFKITCNIEFEHRLIRKQSCSIEVVDHIFEREISSARTFGFLHEVEYMKRYGLARGGSLDNAVVIDKSGILNEEGLRYQDEFVRHKLLDCIGDFSLLGMPILGHIVTNKSGHAFNHAFLEKFFNKKTCWQTLTMPFPPDPAHKTVKSLAI
ncbi:MAG: UDP-3-O-acyl-N-acetylglucosamine deacetylase [Deltaproteobacteria bacterium]|jgi:UDP-3-O-[3-hydroxymyristoyl] N-acetylglucosamine deacetylase|nr:UDP-3-O-acyl-N-acetylglucosamine deacetylase [Deltaproteobacteria bacterium]